MHRPTRMLAATPWLSVTLLASCGKEPTAGPPDILYGVHACEVCRMIISDERFATGLVATDSRDGTRAIAFDDVNCMLRFESENPEAAISARFVHDHDTLAWVRASDATFIYSRSLQTPMASGVAAFSEPDRAATFVTRQPGETLDLEALRARFRAGTLKAGPA